MAKRSVRIRVAVADVDAVVAPSRRGTRGSSRVDRLGTRMIPDQRGETYMAVEPDEAAETTRKAGGSTR
jgi:hypothetical protein